MKVLKAEDEVIQNALALTEYPTQQYNVKKREFFY